MESQTWLKKEQSLVGTAAFYNVTPRALTASHGPLGTGVPLAGRRAEPAGRRHHRWVTAGRTYPGNSRMSLNTSTGACTHLPVTGHSGILLALPFPHTQHGRAVCLRDSGARLTSRSCSRRRRVRLRTMWRLRTARPTLRASSSASSRPPTAPVATDGTLGLEQGGTRRLVTSQSPRSPCARARARRRLALPQRDRQCAARQGEAEAGS